MAQAVKEKMRLDAQEAVPIVPQEQAELQASAMALARDVGMEGLAQLRTILDGTGGVDSLQEMVTRSARVDPLLQKHKVEDLSDIVSRSARVETILAEAGLGDEGELRKATSLVKAAKRAPGLDQKDVLQTAEAFVANAVAVQKKIGTTTDFTEAMQLFLATRQSIHLQYSKDNNRVIKMVKDMLATSQNIGEANFNKLLGMQAMAGGFESFEEKVRSAIHYEGYFLTRSSIQWPPNLMNFACQRV
jgi:hypothetical protein